MDRSEECGAGEAAVEEVVRDLVPGLGRRLGAHWLIQHGVVFGNVHHQVRQELRRNGLPSGLADVVQHAAGAEHHGEVLQLDLRALLQARPPALELAEGVDGDAAELGDLLVESVLRPGEVLVGVGDEQPVGERVAGAADDP
uniref:Uncharacterized protein n=1 Tax=Avena sativa TaxID=4498 RepID=A0ACD5TCX8_AVESA